MYVMFDSVTLSEIPGSAPVVAGYVGGLYETFPHLAADFPHAKHVSIAINASEDADVLDIEKGDAVPAQAVDWVKRQKARGVKRPAVYASVSGMQEIVGLLESAGIARASVRLWTAHYTDSPHLCGAGCGYGMSTTSDATQWTMTALGRNLDESLVASDWFGPLPPPPKPADPHGYMKFYDSEFVWRGRKLPSERKTVELYDHLRVHGVLNRRKLEPVRDDLRQLADRIAAVVIAESRETGKPRDWKTFDRGLRYAGLIHRAQGERFA